MSFEDIYETRKGKRDKLVETGYAPYVADTHTTHTLAQMREVGESSDTHVIAGRVMAVRGQGAIVFFDLFDGTGRFQGVAQRDILGDEEQELFLGTVDIGDFIEASGTTFTTKQGELTLQATSWRMLTKTLRPLPDKHHGLKNVEERYRRRYLDLLLDDEARETFRRKAQFWQTVRSFLVDKGYLEVETPTLEHTTGGAEARPFTTHHNDLDVDVHLRISVGELWQKRLTAAGFREIFEIGRVYRNEGSSPEHVQEFTNAEFYASYLNFEDGIEMVIDLYRTLAEKVYGTTKFTKGEYEFDLADEWERLDYVKTVEEKTGVNVLTADESELKAKLDELGVEYDGDNRERLMDTLWKYCRKQVAGPAILINHPKLVAPLSKTREDNPETTYTMQVILAGSEIGRGHAELNDPQEQRARFEEQQKLLEAGDDEAMMPDWDYVEAMEYGFPPMFGFGFGERLFATFENKPIRETQMFPLLRPKHESE